MSIGSISFWQQDQNFWGRAQQQDHAQAQTTAVISAMSSAMTNQAQGLAAIANQTALNRVTTQLSAAVQSVLSGNSGSSTSSNASGSSSGSGASTVSTPPPPDAPASGTGTAPLSTSTSLLTLGILKKGQITVTDGTNTTTYTSTGSDTVGDLINAINANKFGNADVAAGLDASGRLTITAKNNTDTIIVGGAYAPNVGFGGGNDTFAPTPPPSASNSSGSTAATSATSTGGGSASGSSDTSGSSTAGGSATSPSGIPKNSAFALQTGGTAAMLLASNGGAGSLINMLT